MNFQFDTNSLVRVIVDDRLKSAEQARFIATYKKNSNKRRMASIRNMLETLWSLSRSNRLAVRTPVQYIDMNATLECPTC